MYCMYQRSCETQLVTLLHDLASTLDKGIQMDILVFDFSKAIDHVLLGRLCRKLHQYDIRGNTHTVGSRPSFLAEPRESRAVHQTICQLLAGSHKVLYLGLCSSYPLLMTYPTRSTLRHVYLPMTASYRDQYMTLVIARPCSKDFYTLAEWELKWNMEFHPQKCSVLSVSRARFAIRHPNKLKGHILETEESTKYLDVDL